MPDNYLGNPNWAPSGFVDPMDEYVMRWQFSNSLVIPGQYYAYNFPFDGRQNGDEYFGGNSYQYIPTEVQVGSALTIRNMATAGEMPVTPNDPGMLQILQSLYSKTVQFWQDIRDASGTGS